jgi:hypothetical protein
MVNRQSRRQETFPVPFFVSRFDLADAFAMMRVR